MPRPDARGRTDRQLEFTGDDRDRAGAHDAGVAEERCVQSQNPSRNKLCGMPLRRSPVQRERRSRSPAGNLALRLLPRTLGWSTTNSAGGSEHGLHRMPPLSQRRSPRARAGRQGPARRGRADTRAILERRPGVAEVMHSIGRARNLRPRLSFDGKITTRFIQGDTHARRRRRSQPSAGDLGRHLSG